MRSTQEAARRSFLRAVEQQRRRIAAGTAGVGNVPTPTSPEAMRDYIERDTARWNRVVEIKKIERY